MPDLSRVLIAEDNLHTQQMIAVMVEQFGLQFGLANNGAEAVQLSQQQTFGLAIFDLHMPELTGCKAIRAIRDGGGVNAGMPAVAISADYDFGQLEALFDAGFNVFLPKPFDPLHLYDAMRTACEEARRPWPLAASPPAVPKGNTFQTFPNHFPVSHPAPPQTGHDAADAAHMLLRNRRQT